jgi:hypothetical protein
VPDDKIMVWRDLIIIFYFVICGLVVSTVVLAFEFGCNKLKTLVIR